MSKKLLIVDDNEADRNLIKEILAEKGVECTVVIAESAEGALELMSSDKPDIAVVDTRMPGKDGFEACRQMKEIHPAIKVIVQTGVVDAVDAGKARSAGADDYCVKTADCESLIEKIKKYL